MKSILMIGALLISTNISASPIGKCDGTPRGAVMELPSPINEWGVIVCTPYGHFISNKEGWIWSKPGGYSPVMIPSQMVKENLEELGNKSFFTEISLKKMHGKEAASAIELIESGFDKSPKSPNVYSMKVMSISGKQLAFQFFEFDYHHWGMWCNEKCEPTSRFMILNMNKKPNNAN